MAQTFTVNINNMAFNPPSLGITKGDTVIWVNQMQMDHTATADNGEFDSGDIQPNRTFTHTFPTGHTSGPVSYSCTIHDFMTGTVNVT
jgi:plastocyanin